ncbi:hypothetical protein L1N85_15110 [Paenibacillus alkaliterrae]|uniref:CBO0543 family protein n=1 Tax=Paenibacillus alkaliterrae TaxID=320909 RepID=UPI001F1F04AF|nr:CBO0543 family protein [Paenibacillus alkaliterrae]MCF2939748.1 hypothetical protein [Paenibacillus alkaliterrae]
MHFVYNALFLYAGIKWGDWRRWRDYYPTILFFICGDLLMNFLLYNYSMWTYQETFFGEQILRNHTFISLMIMFIVYPSTILIYLGRFPQGRWKQALWVAFWTLLYSSMEYINLHYLHLIKHHNGWEMWWSVFFNVFMFLIIKIHYKHPLLAWGISIIMILFLWFMFDIPIEKLK